MIIGQQQNNIEKIGLDSSKKAGINQDKLGKLQYILTKGLYQDAQSAVIVEWANNGVDSIVQSKKDPIENPVIVKIGNRKLSVEDKGIGLNKDEFENVCMSYLSSTKENNNDTIGHFGLGMKSFIALDRSAIFTCRKDGVEIKYIAYQGEEFMEYDVIYEKETTEENGLICEIDIKDSYEEQTFISKARTKLAYYDTVVLIIDGIVQENQIIRSDNWQFSDNSGFNLLHLCLKDVVYEINYSKLGIPQINIPIALRFDLSSGLCPIPSREALIYNQETIILVKDKIKSIANFFIDRYNSEWKEYESFIEAMPHIHNYYYYVNIAGKDFCIDALEKYADSSIKTLKIKGIDINNPSFYFNLKGNMFAEYEKAALYDSWTFKTKRTGYNSIMWHLEQKYTLIEVTSVPVGYTRKYLLEKYNGRILFVKKFTKRKLGDRNKVKVENYIYLLSLNNYKRETWRARIKEWQRVENEFISKIIDETNIQIPEDWLAREKEAKKANINKPKYNSKALNKEKGQVTLAWAKKSYADKVTFDKSVHNISDLKNRHFLTIYGTSDHKEILSRVFRVVPAKVHVIIANKSEVKHLKDRHNFISIEKFIMGDNKTFGKIATSILFQREIDEFNLLFRNDNQILQKCTKKYYDDYQKLTQYSNDNYKNSGEMNKEILQMAETYNLWDYTLWEEYKNVKKCNVDYAFVNQLKAPGKWDSVAEKRYNTTISQMLLFRKKYYNELQDFEIQLIPIKKEELEIAEF